MRVFLQRVSKAKVEVEGKCVGQISKGLLLLIGIEEEDTLEDIDWLCNKISKLRIFSDAEDKMNLSIQDINGQFLAISQFTLHASTKKGNRPSFIKAAKPSQALLHYQKFVERLKQISGLKVETGVFGANMQVELINDGPVSIWMDSKNKE